MRFYSPSTNGFYDGKKAGHVRAMEKLDDVREIDDDNYRQLMTDQLAADKNIVPDADGKPIVVDVVVPIDELIDAKRLSLKRDYENALELIHGGYSQTEINGWPAQLNEVKQYRDEAQRQQPNPENYPLLNSLAEMSGKTLADRVDRVEQKHKQFAEAYGKITGLLHKLNDDLKAIDTAADDAEQKIAAIDASELNRLSKTLFEKA